MYALCITGPSSSRGGDQVEAHRLTHAGGGGRGRGGRPHRAAFPGVTGGRGADPEVGRAHGRVVGVTWQGGARAHGAAGEGLPRGLWDRARGEEEAVTGQRARVGEGVCWTPTHWTWPGPTSHAEVRGPAGGGCGWARWYLLGGVGWGGVGWGPTPELQAT